MHAELRRVGALLVAAALWPILAPVTSLERVAADAAPAQGGTVRWGADVLRQEPAWYASAEARAIADAVLLHQRASGGWPKNSDMTVPPSQPPATDPPDSTIDNGATTTEMRFLALVAEATGSSWYREAFERGVDYLLAAQYPGGGWPQYYPLREGYYSRITYNDHAMVNVLSLLRDAAHGTRPYAFVDPGRRARAAAAVDRGIDVILRTQVRQNGTLTAWCAQHDERTLEPAWARNYEPPSLSGNETVGIVRFLMDTGRTDPAVVAAVQAAAAWLEAVPIRGLRVEEYTDTEGHRDRRVVADPAAGPLWARFYELGTNRPIFIGRDRVIRYEFGGIERERRMGYAYLGTWPATLLATEYPRWQAALARPSSRLPE
jgi:PelA/Pel-15E family pectate lyase